MVPFINAPFHRLLLSLSRRARLFTEMDFTVCKLPLHGYAFFRTQQAALPEYNSECQQLSPNNMTLEKYRQHNYLSGISKKHGNKMELLTQSCPISQNFIKIVNLQTPTCNLIKLNQKKPIM